MEPIRDKVSIQSFRWEFREAEEPDQVIGVGLTHMKLKRFIIDELQEEWYGELGEIEHIREELWANLHGKASGYEIRLRPS